MCDPITIGFVSAAGSLTSGFMSKKIGDANAKAYDQAAKNREEKAKFDSEQALTKYDRTRGAAVAAIGTTGFDIASFSDVFADSATESALEVKAIKYQGTVEANYLRFQADSQRYQGNAALIGSVFQAAGQVGAGYGKSQGMNQNVAAGTTVGYQPWNYQMQRFAA